MLAIAASDHVRGEYTPEGLAEKFNISPELLERPTTALSGGERMLVSLAKAFALSASAQKVCICSPYFWLDPSNRQLVKERFGSAVRCEDVRLLLLGGEEDTGVADASCRAPRALSWHLSIDHPSVLFPHRRGYFAFRTSAAAHHNRLAFSGGSNNSSIETKKASTSTWKYTQINPIRVDENLGKNILTRRVFVPHNLCIRVPRTTGISNPIQVT